MKKGKWESKEARELFCKTVNSFIIKTGSDKDPIIEAVCTMAKQVVDNAFKYYPDESAGDEEEPDFGK